MTETTFPAPPSEPGTVLLPCAIAENAARGTALALAFARRGWDVGVYYDDDGGDGDGAESRADDADSADAEAEADDSADADAGRRAVALTLCAAVTALGRRAAAFPVSTRPGRGASADAPDGQDASRVETLVQRCARRLGRPRCVVSAPLRVEHDAAGRLSGPALARMHHANLWIALALAQTLSEAVAADDRDGGGRESDDGAGPDAAVVVNIVDSLLPEVRRDAVLFALTQSAVANATPVLARRYAPRLRVVAVSTPLLAARQADAGDNGRAIPDDADGAAVRTDRTGRVDRPAGGPLDASLAQAVCYLAEAATITGSTLLVDGGLGCAPPAGADAAPPVHPVAARERSCS